MEKAPICPECGTEMEINDVYSFSFGIGSAQITEWKCPECGEIWSDEPPFEE